VGRSMPMRVPVPGGKISVDLHPDAAHSPGDGSELNNTYGNEIIRRQSFMGCQ